MGENMPIAGDIEQRLARLEKREKRDGWRKVQVLGAVLTPLMIAGVGTFFTVSMRSVQAREETSQLVLSVIAERESSDASTRARMFEALLALFFREDPGPSEKVTLLHLMQANFADTFSTRALFEWVHNDPDISREEREHLRKIAKEAIQRQELFLNKGSGKTFQCLVGESEQVHFGHHGMTVTVLDFDEDGARIRLEDPTGNDLPLGPVEFDVTYYDMPLTDYTTLADGHRFAITFKGLHETENGFAARLSAFEFDEHRILPRDRPTLASLQKLMREVRELGMENERESGAATHHDSELPGFPVSVVQAKQPEQRPHGASSQNGDEHGREFPPEGEHRNEVEPKNVGRPTFAQPDDVSEREWVALSAAVDAVVSAEPSDPEEWASEMLVAADRKAIPVLLNRLMALDLTARDESQQAARCTELIGRISPAITPRWRDSIEEEAVRSNEAIRKRAVSLWERVTEDPQVWENMRARSRPGRR